MIARIATTSNSISRSVTLDSSMMAEAEASYSPRRFALLHELAHLLDVGVELLDHGDAGCQRAHGVHFCCGLRRYPLNFRGCQLSHLLERLRLLSCSSIFESMSFSFDVARGLHAGVLLGPSRLARNLCRCLPRDFLMKLPAWSLLIQLAPGEWNPPTEHDRRLTRIGAKVCRRAALLARFRSDSFRRFSFDRRRKKSGESFGTPHQPRDARRRWNRFESLVFGPPCK